MPVEIRMPELSKDMAEADLVAWLVQPGDRVRAGDLIAEIETDKATVELEADAAGIVSELRIAAGTTGVKVGEVLALLETDGTEETTPAPTSAADSPDTASAQPAAAVAAVPASPAAGERQDIAATALARRIADQSGVSLGTLQGTGPGGKIVKRDVETASSAAVPAAETTTPAAPEAFDAPFSEVPHSRMRRTIATRLSQAKRDVPHFYLRAECAIDRLLEVRRQLAAGGARVSVNDFIIRAVALALRAVPEAHVAWRDDAMLRFERADVSVAVATDEGLVTPVVRGADRKGLAAIAEEMRDLAERARTKKLRPAEYQGGTFTVSNLGMYGVESVTPILNPPQSGILGIGAGVERPWVRDGELGVATIMVCTLAADHRALDGAAGARLLSAFQARIEDPLEMIL